MATRVMMHAPKEKITHWLSAKYILATATKITINTVKKIITVYLKISGHASQT